MFLIEEDELESILTRKKKNPLGVGHGSQRVELTWQEREEIVDHIRSRTFYTEHKKKCVECGRPTNEQCDECMNLDNN